MVWKKDSSFSVGLFLAIRDIRRSNIWTTSLIVFIMTLTFFNMLLLGGILLGIAEGVINSFKFYYSSDVLVTPTIQKRTIEQTDSVMAVIKSLPTYKAATKRLTASATVENTNQIKIRETDTTESASATLVGIDPVAEDTVTHLSSKLIEGSYLDSADSDAALLGQNLLEKYVRGPDVASTAERKLTDVQVGSRVTVIVGGVRKEVTVKGIIGTDNANIDIRIFMVDTSARSLVSRTDPDVNEIAIALIQGNSDREAKEYILKNLGKNSENIIVQTAEEALPSATADIKQTFSLLGNMVGFIALIVGAITIFIVIFVNAITRRKFIGILKGIGISSRAIEISYVLQAFFYALSGIIIGSFFIVGFIDPYFDLHPLNLPITRSRLAVTPNDLLLRGFILTITALLSGFIPAWLVTKQNTLDAILGR